MDAGAATATYNLSRGRSLLIFVGGEREQLMTREGECKVYVRSRLGFVRLAMQFGTPLVPLYAFGENELYRISDMFMSPRLALQKYCYIGLPLCWGDTW